MDEAAYPTQEIKPTIDFTPMLCKDLSNPKFMLMRYSMSPALRTGMVMKLMGHERFTWSIQPFLRSRSIS